MKQVYLAGPITGLHFTGAQGWRQHAMEELAQHGIRGLTPLRGKEYLASLASISGHGREYEHMGVLSTPRAVMTRDHFDATRCDVLLANLLGAERVSIGTVMEIAWAHTHHIPVVCAIDDESNPHWHMMVLEAIGFRVPDMRAAIDVTVGILR